MNDKGSISIGGKGLWITFLLTWGVLISIILKLWGLI
jgi:hypothetical protein